MKLKLLVALLATFGGVVVYQTQSCAAPEGVVAAPPITAPAFSGRDAGRKRIAIELVPVVVGIDQPTDIQAVPGQPGLLALLTKEGQALLAEPAKGTVKLWFQVAVNTRSEMGLLGLAFHPNYAKSGRFFVHYNPDGAQKTRISEWQAPTDPRSGAPKEVRVLLEVEQPWANHDGGQLQFGPDGLLYIGLGDGGAADDPKDAGQDRQTLLGKMLRIGVDPQGERPYTIPADNPFVGDAGTRPEIWALGLRNPWRYSFTPTGRLITGDVGQNLWEEITYVGRGDNLGWRRREANQCFPPGTACDPQGLVDPVYVYGRDDGASVTGGYVYTGSEVPDLKDKYVFGDFASGRLWALDLQAPQEALALGQWGIYPATFGVGHAGELYVGDFREGRILQIRSGR